MLFKIIFEMFSLNVLNWRWKLSRFKVSQASFTTSELLPNAQSWVFKEILLVQLHIALITFSWRTWILSVKVDYSFSSNKVKQILLLTLFYEHTLHELIHFLKFTDILYNLCNLAFLFKLVFSSVLQLLSLCQATVRQKGYWYYL